MTHDDSIERYTSDPVKQFGESRRVVAFGDGDADEYEIRHIRDDVAQQYSRLERRGIFEDAVLEALATPR